MNRSSLSRRLLPGALFLAAVLAAPSRSHAGVLDFLARLFGGGSAAQPAPIQGGYGGQVDRNGNWQAATPDPRPRLTPGIQGRPGYDPVTGLDNTLEGRPTRPQLPPRMEYPRLEAPAPWNTAPGRWPSMRPRSSLESKPTGDELAILGQPPGAGDQLAFETSLDGLPETDSKGAW